MCDTCGDWIKNNQKEKDESDIIQIISKKQHFHFCSRAHFVNYIKNNIEKDEL